MLQKGPHRGPFVFLTRASGFAASPEIPMLLVTINVSALPRYRRHRR